MSRGEIDPNRLFLAITNCLQVVFIDLDQRERPFEIFESLNAKAKPLSPADLVRNYIAMRLPEAKQEEIFDKYWAPLDDLLKEKRTVGKSRLGELTAFLRHYMAMLVGFLPNERHVYERFRDRMEKDFSEFHDFVSELSVLKRFGTYYDRLLRPSHEPIAEISRRLERLNTLEVSTAYPFLLAMYDARDAGRLTSEAFLQGLDVLENYLVRRYLAGEPANYLNKMFPTLWPLLDLDNFAQSLQQALLARNYPSDSKIKQALYTEVLYKGSHALEKTKLILEAINQQLSAGSGGYTVLDGSATIEHIMPQTLSESWKKHLGQNWDQTYRDYLNTIGNLTLVTQGWNSTLSNEVFERKKSTLAGHALKLNSSYFSTFSGRWDESAIRSRSEFLAEQILKIWTAFGEPPSKVTGKGTVPKILTIIGDSHRVNSWRDVQFITTETVIQYVKNFDSVVAEIPNYFFKEETRYTHRQLSNGLWLYTNLSGASVRNFCHRIIDLAGIPEEEWAVEEE